MTIDELLAIYSSPTSVAPSPALEGLDAVDWSAVKDAYGPATGVPSLLRAMVSNNAAHREFACMALFQVIWHQGNVYSATAAAIPFLYSLLEERGPQDKDAIAQLLAEIAAGKPPFLHCQDDAEAAAKWRDILAASGESLDAKIVEGRKVAEEIRRQLMRKPELLARCLK